MIKKGVLFGMVASLLPSSAGQGERDALLVIPAIIAAAEKPDLIEVMRLYDSNPGLARVGNGSVTADMIDAAFDVALAAIVLDDPDFRTILAWAEDLADRGIRSGSPQVLMNCGNAHHDVLSELQRRGRVVEAYSVAERAVKRRSGAMNGRGMPRELNRFLSSISEFGELLPLLMGIGDLEALEGKYEKAIKELNSYYGSVPGSPAISHLPGLAELKARLGKYDEARDLLREFEQKKGQLRGILPEDVPGVQGMLTMLESARQMVVASAWIELDEPAIALRILDEAGAIYEKSIKSVNMTLEVGKQEDRDVLDSIQKGQLAYFQELRASCHLALGRGDDAEKAILASIALLEGARLGGWMERTKSAEMKTQLAWARWMNGNHDGAKALAKELAQEHVEMVGDLLDFAVERQRLAFLQQLDPFSLLATTGQEEDLIPAVLRLKGLVLDSILEERRLLANIGEGEGQALLAQLRDHRHRLGSAALIGAEEKEKLRAETERLERSIASLASTRLEARQALGITEDRIRQALSPADAAIDFVRYRHLTDDHRWEPRYGAVVIRSKGPGQWIPLGAASVADSAIARLNAHFNGTQTITMEEEFKADLRMLYNRLLAPLKPHLGDATRLLLGPDGNLSLLSFAVLLDSNDRFACESWEIAYVSSLRDLLRETQDRTARDSSMLILAAPDFSAVGDAADEGEARRGASAFDPDSLPRLAPLPGALLEMGSLRELAEGLGLTVASYSGAGATEGLFRTLDRAPGVIHLATHGLMLPASRSARAAARERGPGSVELAPDLSPVRPGGGGTGPRFSTPPVTNHPLERSILALSGANATFGRWREGHVPPPASDGVLTAAEIATLDLSATWLAVLSACQTASGEAVPGEGVLGMRRGFYTAGVDHLMMTFWPIADSETVDVMKAFYQKIGGGAHPASALHQVQRDALASWREERGLMHAVFLAGPFAITTSGRPYSTRGPAEAGEEGEPGDR